MCNKQHNANVKQTALAGLASSQQHEGYNPEAIKAAVNTLAPFIGLQQLEVMVELMGGEEGEFFITTALKLARKVDTMPKTGDQDGLEDMAVVHLHYFFRGCDWFITERDIDLDGEGQCQAFGYADLGMGFPELGYISIAEITEVGAELDFHWTPCTLGDLKAKRGEV